MSTAARKEAIRRFKEQTPGRGVFAVRCTASGRTWVGHSQNLGASHNGIWFALQQHAHRDRALQADWDAHGEASFQFEVLHTLDPGVSAFAMADTLKTSAREWTARLQARPLLP